MCTGDNVLTARSIALQCGIFTPGGIIMGGPVFRQLSDNEMLEMLPCIQVLARSSPEDKKRLVLKAARLRRDCWHHPRWHERRPHSSLLASAFSWASLAVTEDIGRQLITTGGRMTPKQIEITIDAVTTEEIK